jgi:hypothetical protein
MVTANAIHRERLKSAGTPARLEVNVIYTGCRSTLCALREAARLASSLHAPIRIVPPSIVPYPLSLREPPVREAHQRRMLTTIASGSPIETVAQIVYCRNYTDVNRAMQPGSLVVIGGSGWRWLPFGRLRALKRVLGRAGHHVIPVTDEEGRHA